LAQDIQGQIDYGRRGSKDDMEAAEVLLEKGKFRQSLFLAHLALEKML
jgi:HEPN domain-containing protein